MAEMDSKEEGETMKKENVEHIFNCLKQATEQALVYMTFGLWTKKKHPELWTEFLKEAKA